MFLYTPSSTFHVKRGLVTVEWQIASGLRQRFVDRQLVVTFFGLQQVVIPHSVCHPCLKRQFCNHQANQVVISCSTHADAPESRIRIRKPVSVSGPNYLASSNRLPHQERKFTSTVSLPDMLWKRQWNRFQRTGSARRWDGTFFTA